MGNNCCAERDGKIKLQSNNSYKTPNKVTIAAVADARYSTKSTRANTIQRNNTFKTQKNNRSVDKFKKTYKKRNLRIDVPSDEYNEPTPRQDCLGDLSQEAYHQQYMIPNEFDLQDKQQKWRRKNYATQNKKQKNYGYMHQQSEYLCRE